MSLSSRDFCLAESLLERTVALDSELSQTAYNDFLSTAFISMHYDPFS